MPLTQDRMITVLEIADALANALTQAHDLTEFFVENNDALKHAREAARTCTLPREHPIWHAIGAYETAIAALTNMIQAQRLPLRQIQQLADERAHFISNARRNSESARRMRNYRARIRDGIPAAAPQRESQRASQAVMRAEELENWDKIPEHEAAWTPRNWTEVLVVTEQHMHKGASMEDVQQAAEAWALQRLLADEQVPYDTPSIVQTVAKREKAARAESDMPEDGEIF